MSQKLDIRKRMSPEGRKALIGAQGGLFVDMFDVYLPIIVLAPATMYFEPSGVSESTSRILTALVFAATLLGRPLGALIFGHLSDRSGRRRTTIISMVGFGVTTLAIAALPGFHSIGITAVILLVLLRFIDGIFLGGQYTASAPLALEHSPQSKRGLNGSILMTGFPLAYCATALVTFVLLQLIPAAGLDSPYVQWGWRIPFVFGGLMALVLAVWFARNVRESDAWKGASRSKKSPVLELFRGDNLRGFIQVFILMSGIWLSFNMVGAVLPGVLIKSGIGSIVVTKILIAAYALLVVAYLGAGILSQRIGRRQFFFLQGTAIAVLAPVLFWVLAAGAVSSPLAIGAVIIALVIVVVSIFAVVTTYIIERFHTGIRSSGYGLGYTAAVILPAFYAFFQVALGTVMPFEFTPVVLLALGGVLIVLGAALGPETKDVDLAAGAPTDAGIESMSSSMVGVPVPPRSELAPAGSSTSSLERDLRFDANPDLKIKE
ncbi:MFS transporter [Rhodococcus opacus]|uniref:MFS transporter n=1 Tax=Rhodococcus opacus TaxID=37919 RepID=UPI001C476FAD|nr:MFS transporter [Rhodococcus opacus]MBV6755885.1 MFS transporter [Rhodococcus opacus]